MKEGPAQDEPRFICSMGACADAHAVQDEDGRAVQSDVQEDPDC